jgi:hypothetical protein
MLACQTIDTYTHHDGCSTNLFPVQGELTAENMRIQTHNYVDLGPNIGYVNTENSCNN